MNADRLPLFCDTALAERIERAEAQLIAGASLAARARRADAAGFVIPVADGVASFAEQDSPFNKVAGLGFAGAPDADALDEVEQAFAAYGSPVQVELANLGDPAIGVLLTGRGYRLVSFENVLGRAVISEPERVTPPGVEVRRCGEEEFDAWLGVVVDAVSHPDTEGVPQHEEFPREAIERAERDLVAAGGVTCYLALCDGVIAGGATMRRPRAWYSSARRPRPHIAAAACRQRCWRPALPMRQRPAATSPWSPPSPGPSPSRTCNVEASTCCIPVPFWSNNPDGPSHADARC
jgi:hypothetical protein